eukprot:10178103-Heterocapsa_arctica.AAC.1
MGQQDRRMLQGQQDELSNDYESRAMEFMNNDRSIFSLDARRLTTMCHFMSDYLAKQYRPAQHQH